MDLIFGRVRQNSRQKVNSSTCSLKTDIQGLDAIPENR